ncbi:MAG TPA: hypothetical protein VFN35_16515 [Ktedonobacteraceae bacterium]|nr:hypothetical protein [Ktedonobacteraceae bacterium]
MTKIIVTETFEERFTSLLPAKLLDPGQSTRLGNLARHIDGLGRFNPATNEVYLDETALRNMMSDFSDLFPSGFEERYIARMKALPDNRLVNGQFLQAVPWAKLAEHVPLLQHAYQAPVLVAGLKDVTTVEELQDALQKLVPQLTENSPIFDPNTFKQHFASLTSNAAGRPASESVLPEDLGSVWNCFVSNWGWWGAALAVAALVAIGTALGILGPIQIIIQGIALGVFGGYLVAALIGLGGVAAVLLACILSSW